MQTDTSTKNDTCVLGLTTVASPGGTVLWSPERGVWGQCLVDRGPRPSQVLLSQVSSMLTESQLECSELGGIAVCIGPGSFTGIRVGMAVARGLAYGHALPIVGIDTFDAAIAQADDAGLTDSWRLVALDARRGEVYLQWFAPGASQPEGPATTEKPDKVPGAVQERLKSGTVTIIGDAVGLYGDSWAVAGGEISDCANSVDPVTIARIGWSRIAAQKLDHENLKRVLPSYIRRTDRDLGFDQAKKKG